MQYHNVPIIIFLLLLHPLSCFTASSSSPPSPKSKANKHELENAIKNKSKAERKMKLYFSNVDDALNNEVLLGHTGHQKWVHLVGERKKAEAEAKVHHLASKIILKDHNTPLPNIFHDRAVEFNKKASRIQSEMDLTKAKSIDDLDVFNKNVDAQDKKIKDHDHAIAEYDKIIHRHNH